MLGYYNTDIYALYSKSLGQIPIEEPIGFRDDGKTYSRDGKSKGMLYKRSSNIELYGTGYKKLHYIARGVGVNEEVYLIKYKKSSVLPNQQYELVYRAIIDTRKLKFSHKNKTVKVAFTEGGLYHDLQNKISTSFDFINKRSVDHKDIGPLNTINVQAHSKEILLKSRFEIEDGTEFENFGHLNAWVVLPFNVDYNSNPDNLTSPSEYTQEVKPEGMIITDNKSKRTLSFDIELNFDYLTDLSQGLRNPDIWINILKCSYNVETGEYENFTSYNSDKILPNPTNNNLSFKKDIVVEKGESLMVRIHLHQAEVLFSESYMTIEEQSVDLVPFREIKAITYKEALNRSIAKITGKNGLVVSKLLDEGRWEYLSVTNGFFIRQFPYVSKSKDGTEKRIQFNLSLQHIIDDINSVTPIAWWTEIQNGREVFRLEKLEYTQQNFIGISIRDQYGNYIDVSSSLEEYPADKNYYSNLTFGASKGGSNYEIKSGLDEFNGKTQFNTVNRTKYKYTAVSKSRRDSTAIELAKRKNYKNYPEEDTTYDQDMFMVDLKKVGNQYFFRRWQDDFEEKPKNINNADTAYNIDLSPANCMKRHEAPISSGLLFDKHTKITPGSSNANSSLVTKKAGLPELPENDAIEATFFKNARIKNFAFKFKAKLFPEVSKQVEGKNENGVPNWFGLVEYMSAGSLKYGRLVKLDPKKEGSWELIEANFKG